MQSFFYKLNGGINTAKTRTALGFVDNKKMYWDDAVNVEILKNTGVCRQRGNILLFKLPFEEKIVGIHEYPKNTDSFVLVTSNGKIYHYNSVLSETKELYAFSKGVSVCSFVYYLDGLVIATDTNGGVYFEMGATSEFTPLNLKNATGQTVCATAMAVYAGRLWVGSGSTLYFSALGRFNDWSSSEDAGYIEKFHCSTSKIVAIKEYVGCLAVYKEDGVWILSGTTVEDFSISRFADKGVFSQNGVLNYDNKQFFVNNNGIFALEQAGELSQISISGNLAHNIRQFFENINYAETAKTLVVGDDRKNRIWFFLPFLSNAQGLKSPTVAVEAGSDGEDAEPVEVSAFGDVENPGGQCLNEIFIYDYYCCAWLKRVIPYEITCAAAVFGNIISASARGEVFLEDVGNTFAKKPIEFSLSTPFFNLARPTVRKIIEDLTFIFDDSRENQFKFAVSKDYIQKERFDVEFVTDVNPATLMWWDFETVDNFNSVWANEENEGFCWFESGENAYKTDVFDSNKAVQLHIEGQKAGDDFAIVGIEFKEVIIDE